MAIGRRPVLDNINANVLDLEVNKEGKLIVDEKWRTSVDNIYAIGDTIDSGLELTPVAIREG